MNTVALVLVASLFAQAKDPDDVHYDRDVVYGKASGEDLKLNLARPKNPAGPLPAVVIFAGGGWKGAGRKDLMDRFTQEFARRGFVAATVDTRSTPTHLFPAQIEDAKCAVRFMRAHAEKYGIDPKRVGSVGFSAGGHLALMTGVGGKEDGFEGDGGWAEQPSQANAVVAFCGPSDFVNAKPSNGGNFEFFLGAKLKDNPELYRKASPITYVKKTSSPMLLLQGTSDDMVPWTQATAMGEALTAAGVPGRVELLLGAGHRWSGAEWNRSIEECYAFMSRELKAQPVR